MKKTQIANYLTGSRFVLAPIFAVLYAVIAAPDRAGSGLISAIWTVFLAIELTDILDGYAARTFGTVTDIGKVMDPFADVVARLTYFVCLVHANILPLWFLLVLLYRELGIILLRMILLGDGVALAAKTLGKLKSWLYGVCAGVGLLLFSHERLDTAAVSSRIVEIVEWFLLGLLIVTALLSVISFTQYLLVFLRQRRTTGTSEG